MTLKRILVTLLACMALAASAQPTQQQPEWEWYLDEVVSETFVGRNYFEYYYTPSAADMAQQRDRGEVTYFLNSPDGLNSKKVRDMIDRLMMSYDDIKAVSDWHMTNTTYWKEFRYEKNKFRFSVKRKALDDGTYYVSVTETACFYKSLAKKNQQDEAKPETKPKSKAESKAETDKPTKSSKREKVSSRSTRDRKPVVLPDEQKDDAPTLDDILNDVQEPEETAVSEKQQRREEAQRREDERREARLRQRQEQEKRREEDKAQKEAEKLKKAEEKKQRQEQERLAKEEKKQRQAQERERQRKEREARQAKEAKKSDSRYHYSDVALWLSEKYDFTQTAMTDNGCTMYSTVVKDVEMAKLAIKNALKGSNARMAVPWRVNSETGAIETGYTVDGHVLVFTIGKDEQQRITLTVTEVSGEDFELFKKSL